VGAAGGGRMARHEHLERINAYPQQELVRKKNKAGEEKPEQEQNGASGKRHSCFSARGKETPEQCCWALGEEPLPVRDSAFLTFAFLFTSASDFSLFFVFPSLSDFIPSLFLSPFSLIFSVHPSHTLLPFFCSKNSIYFCTQRPFPLSQQPGGIVPACPFSRMELSADPYLFLVRCRNGAMQRLSIDAFR